MLRSGRRGDSPHGWSVLLLKISAARRFDASTRRTILRGSAVSTDRSRWSRTRGGPQSAGTTAGRSGRFRSKRRVSGGKKAAWTRRSSCGGRAPRPGGVHDEKTQTKDFATAAYPHMCFPRHAVRPEKSGRCPVRRMFSAVRRFPSAELGGNAPGYARLGGIFREVARADLQNGIHAPHVVNPTCRRRKARKVFGMSARDGRLLPRQGLRPQTRGRERPFQYCPRRGLPVLPQRRESAPCFASAGSEAPPFHPLNTKKAPPTMRANPTR